MTESLTNITRNMTWELWHYEQNSKWLWRYNKVLAQCDLVISRIFKIWNFISGGWPFSSDDREKIFILHRVIMSTWKLWTVGHCPELDNETMVHIHCIFYPIIMLSISFLKNMTDVFGYMISSVYTVGMAMTQFTQNILGEAWGPFTKWSLDERLPEFCKSYFKVIFLIKDFLNFETFG